MAWFGDKQLVDILTIASILSAAAFGALGLFTDFKKDGKVTRYGRLAVGGIMLSAAFSIGVGLLQGRIEAKRSEAAAAKEAVDRDREGRRFAAQITRLEGLNRTATHLQRGMRDSLQAQDMIIAGARQSMLLTARLGTQERENTGRVLRSMWDESTRVTDDSISVTVSYLCALAIGREFPRLLEHDVYAQLRVAPLAVANRLSATWNRFGLGPELVGEGVALFETVDHRLSVGRSTIWGTELLFQLSRYGPFSSGQWLGFDRPESWQGVAIELYIAGNQPGAVGAVQVAQQGTQGGASLPPGFVASRDLREGGFTVLPCEVRVTVLINGRSVVDTPGAMIQITEGDSGRSGRLIVKSPIVTSARNLFPRFARQ